MKRLLCLSMIIFGSPLLFGAKTPPPEPESVRLPILMYHHVLNSRTGKYIVNEKQLEQDFIFLKNEGYTPVFLSEVIDWVDGRGNLPKKPIVLTFDDGHYSNLHYALPLAKKHDVKFMVFPVTAFSKFTTESNDHSNPNYSHLTWLQIREMAESGLVEFGNHSHNMHKIRPRFGVLRTKSETVDAHREKLTNDLETAQTLIEQSGAPRPTSFAYPFGKYSKQTQAIVKDMGFRAILTCSEGVSVIKRNHPESLYELKRFNRDGHRSTENVFKRLVPAEKVEAIPK